MGQIAGGVGTNGTYLKWKGGKWDKYLKGGGGKWDVP